MARVIEIILFTLSLAFLGAFCHGAEEVTSCIEGPLHKDKPSPEGAGYVECLSWKDKTCCTANFTAELKRNKVEVLYNFSWNHCRNLSQECEKYIKDEECFWQCEPNLIKWHTGGGALNRVPICANYCNNWFEACKDDMTCAEDWLSGFNTSNSAYTCPAQSTCRTFSQVYKNGKGLCDKMWGESFSYETSNNCMVMAFSGPNPNDDVTTVTTVTTDATTPTQSPPSSSASSCFKFPVLILTLANLMSSLNLLGCF